VKLFDKKVFQMSLISNNDLIVILSGKERIIRIKSVEPFLNHSECSFDSKIPETRSSTLFAVDRKSLILCVVIRTRLLLFQIHSNRQPYLYTFLSEINTNGCVTYVDLSLIKINQQTEQILWFGYSSNVFANRIDQNRVSFPLIKERDANLQVFREPTNQILLVIPNTNSTFTNEVLLVYIKCGLYLDYQKGSRTRREELMWSSNPFYACSKEIHLFIYTEKSIDIYNIQTGIWFQSLPLINTSPLTEDGTISLANDFELEKNHLKFILLSKDNQSTTTTLNVQEKTSKKNLTTRNGLFSNTLFNSKPTPSTPISITISGPTDFRHVEHLGHDDGVTILASSPRVSLVQTNSYEQQFSMDEQIAEPHLSSSQNSSQFVFH